MDKLPPDAHCNENEALPLDKEKKSPGVPTSVAISENSIATVSDLPKLCGHNGCDCSQFEDASPTSWSALVKNWRSQAYDGNQPNQDQAEESCPYSPEQQIVQVQSDGQNEPGSYLMNFREPLIPQGPWHHREAVARYDRKVVLQCLIFAVIAVVTIVFVASSIETLKEASEQPKEDRPTDRFDQLKKCAKQLVSGLDCHSPEQDDRCKALAWFQGPGIFIDLGKTPCSWDTAFGMLFALITLRESLQVKDKSWHSPMPVHHASEVCQWKRIHCKNGTVSGLSFNHADLSGTIPPEVKGLKYLEDLLAYSNPTLFGNIPTEIGEAATLERLELHQTSINGTIPTELGNLSHLKNLLLDGTLLTGKMPSQVCYLPELRLLHANCRGLDPMVQCSCCTTCK